MFMRAINPLITGPETRLDSVIHILDSFLYTCEIINKCSIPGCKDYAIETKCSTSDISRITSIYINTDKIKDPVQKYAVDLSII